MTTKEKILENALKLYNEFGIKVITSRHIAKDVGMSPGNLHYHFKNTDDIIEALYYRVLEDYDNFFKELQLNNENINLETFYQVCGSFLKMSYKYRFMLLNTVEVIRRIPIYQESYSVMVKKRNTEFKAIFTKLIEKKLFRNDIPGVVWDSLIVQIFIFGDFWIAHNEVYKKLPEDEAIEVYRSHFANLFYPYLNSENIKKGIIK